MVTSHIARSSILFAAAGSRRETLLRISCATMSHAGGIARAGYVATGRGHVTGVCRNFKASARPVAGCASFQSRPSFIGSAVCLLLPAGDRVTLTRCRACWRGGGKCSLSPETRTGERAPFRPHLLPATPVAPWSSLPPSLVDPAPRSVRHVIINHWRPSRDSSLRLASLLPPTSALSFQPLSNHFSN